MGNTAGDYYNYCCPKCGKPYYYIGDPIGDIDNLICTCYKKENEAFTFIQTGWMCPRCKRVNAPWVTTCSCSPITTWDWTTNATHGPIK